MFNYFLIKLQPDRHRLFSTGNGAQWFVGLFKAHVTSNFDKL